MSGNENENSWNESTLWNLTGIAFQPLVWLSLLSVVTTGSGLPAGPFGIIGGLEGIAYLVVVGLAGSLLWKRLVSKNNEIIQSEKISLITVGLGLLALLSLVADQGCVPNAKPLLDYSEYVKVCNP